MDAKHRATAVIIDEDLSSRMTAARLLSKRVFGAASVREGVAMAEFEQPVLVVAECMWGSPPQRCTPDVLQQVRAVAPNARVIIWTAFWDGTDCASALGAGAWGYVEKGDDLQFLRVVRRVLGRLDQSTTVAATTRRRLQ